MKRILLILLMLLGVANGVGAQITVPNTFSVFVRIESAKFNANFVALGAALNRTGGTLTGSVTASTGVTIDGADISAYLANGKLTAASAAADAVLIGGGITAAGVGIVNTTGKVPAISSSFFTSLVATQLTALGAAQLSGTIASATQDLITRTGTVVSGTWSSLFGNVSGAPLTTLNGSNFSTGTVNASRLGTGSPDVNMILRGDGAWTSLNGSSIPTDLIVFNSTGACGTGFTEFTEARGFAIVGLPSGGTNKGTVGTAFTNLESKSHAHSVPGLNIPALGHPFAFADMSVAGDHSHTLTTGGPSSTNVFIADSPSFNLGATNHTHTATTSSTGNHNHGGSLSGGTTGTGTTGSITTTGVMNYIQLIACRKL